MSVDKLVDSTQLDSDLTSVANAIRTKGGTSASLAFPSGFVSAINAIPTGGGGEPGATFRVKNYVVPSTKFVINNGVKNTLGNGGCIHFRYKLQTNPETAVRYVLSFGRGSLSAWSPGTSNPSCYFVVEKNSSQVIYFQCRGVGNGNQGGITALADANGIIDIKLYASKMVDVNTNTDISYGEAMSALMAAIDDYEYISVGTNYGTAFAGAEILLFAVEESS